MEKPASCHFRIQNRQIVNKTPTFHVITRSKSKQQAKEDEGEGSGEAALEAPSSTDEEFVDTVTEQEKEETRELMEDEMNIDDVKTWGN